MDDLDKKIEDCHNGALHGAVSAIIGSLIFGFVVFIFSFF